MRHKIGVATLSLGLAMLLAGCAKTSSMAEDKALEIVSTANTPALTYALKVKESSQKSALSYDIVKSLTVEVGPRIPGSQGDKRAVAWAEAKLNDLGFDKVYKEPVRVRNWERGFADAKVVSPFPQELIISALGGSIATPESGIEAKVVMFDSLDSLIAADKASVQGNIVFLNTKMQRDKAGRFYGKVVPNRVSGAVEAAKQGAQAVIIRSVGTDNSRFAHTGVMRYDDTVEKIPAGAISTADADNLAAMFASQQSSAEDIILNINMQAKDAGWQTSYNVIGEFTGSEKPDEVILISAHLDSWDEGTGALDDGAGVALTMAAAKHISEIKRPKRSIRVVLFAAEELGLWGAKAYFKKHANELDKIVAAAESDFGADVVYGFESNVSAASLPVVRAIAKQLAPLNVEYIGKNSANGGPDLIPFKNATSAPIFELHQDGTDYFDYHHTADDTLDKIDPAKLKQNTAAYAVFAFMAADAKTTIKAKPVASK